ncbi:hypothetical protein ACJX0J_042398, partial [Zea mays]
MVTLWSCTTYLLIQIKNNLHDNALTLSISLNSLLPWQFTDYIFVMQFSALVQGATNVFCPDLDPTVLHKFHHILILQYVCVVSIDIFSVFERTTYSEDLHYVPGIQENNHNILKFYYGPKQQALAVRDDEVYSDLLFIFTCLIPEASPSPNLEISALKEDDEVILGEEEAEPGDVAEKDTAVPDIEGSRDHMWVISGLATCPLLFYFSQILFFPLFALVSIFQIRPNFSTSPRKLFTSPTGVTNPRVPFFGCAQDGASQGMLLNSWMKNCEFPVAAALARFLGLGCTGFKCYRYRLGTVGFQILEETLPTEVALSHINISKNRDGIIAAYFVSRLICRAPNLVSVNAAENLWTLCNMCMIG